MKQSNRSQHSSLTRTKVTNQLQTIDSDQHPPSTKVQTVGLRSKRARFNTSPGPGSYHLDTMFNKKRGITIVSRSKEPNSNEKQPDPWSYIPKSQFTLKRSPTATIGRQRKIERFKNAPGPSDYKVNFQLLLERGNMPVIGKSRKIETIQSKPGPSDYDTLRSDSLFRRTISHQIGTESRCKTALQIYPGPTDYNIQDELTMKMKTKTGFTMGSKLRSKTTSQSNNFLKYNADKLSTMHRAPAYSIQRNNNHPLSQSFSPGPAAYSPLCRKKGEGITIPKSQRQQIKQDTNSFTTFEMKFLEKGPSFSIPRANSKKKGFQPSSPGPADYSPEPIHQQSYKQISIGSGDRGNFIASNKNPGPGDYSISRVQKGKGFKIGNSKRSPDREQSKVPGPGQYLLDDEKLRKIIARRKK